MPENTVNKLLIASIIILTFVFFYSFKVYLRKSNEFYEWDVNMLTDVNKVIKNNKNYDLSKEINPLYKYHIFYINLDRSSERNEMMINQLKNMFDANYTRISAIDGSKIKNKYKDTVNGDSFINEYENIISSPKNRLNRVVKLSNSEIGCTLSHIKAIRKINEQGLDYAIVMEDDCLLHLSPFWGFDLDYLISKAPKDWGIIQLHIFNNKCKVEENIQKDGMFSELKRTTPCHSTAVYLINKKGVRDVLNVCGYSGDMKIKLQDFGGVADEYIYYLTKTYYTNIPMFLTADQQHKSTIHEKHSDYHINASNDVLQVYKNINDHTIDTYLNQDLQFQYDMLTTLYDLNSFMQSINVNFYLDRESLLHLYREGKFLKSFDSLTVSVIYSTMNESRVDKIKSGNKKFTFVESYGNVNYSYIMILKHIISGKYVMIYFLYNDSSNSLSNLRGMININCVEIMKDCNINYKSRTVIEELYLSPNKKFYCIGPIQNHLQLLYGNEWFISDYIKQSIPEAFSRIQYIWPRKIKESYMPILWIYDDRQKGEKNEYCINQMLSKSKNFQMIVLDDINFENISRSYDINFRNIEPREVRLEYIRCCILNEYGGLFVDYNTRFNVRNIDFIVNDLVDYNVCYIETPENDINPIMLAGKPNNRLYSKVKSVFDNNTDFNSWKTSKTRLNSVLNSEIIKDYIIKLKRYYPREIITYDQNTGIADRCEN